MNHLRWWFIVTITILYNQGKFCCLLSDTLRQFRLGFIGKEVGSKTDQDTAYRQGLSWVLWVPACTRPTVQNSLAFRGHLDWEHHSLLCKAKVSGASQVAGTVVKVCEPLYQLLLLAELEQAMGGHRRLPEVLNLLWQMQELKALIFWWILSLPLKKKTDFSPSKRNMWLMASLKCLWFLDNCFFFFFFLFLFLLTFL